MAKLRSELDLVHVNMTVLRELIAQMKPGNNGKEPPEDFYFINELYSTCKEMQKRVLELIPVVANEEVTYELLSINDEFNATFEKYERCMANFNANGIDLTMVESGSKININEEKLKESGGGGSDLIDFGENNGKGKNEKIDFNSGKDFEFNKNKEGIDSDQVEGVGIRTIAFNKPDAQIGQEGNKKEEENVKKHQSLDDGL
uniref:GAT domain-containing protein n=1 Tax=Meloidogyne incognita TaxID=6306 RepID=A0A914L9U1_MELIC